MPPKRSETATLYGQKKMLPADCFSALMALSGLTSISKAQLELMSHLDGVRTANGYEHHLRSVVAKAKELKKRIEDGEKFEAVPPGGKKGGSSSASPAVGTPHKRKGNGTLTVETPTKKSKTTLKGKKATVAKEDPEHGFGGKGFLSDDGSDFSENEDWKASFV